MFSTYLGLIRRSSRSGAATPGASPRRGGSSSRRDPHLLLKPRSGERTKAASAGLIRTTSGRVVGELASTAARSHSRGSVVPAVVPSLAQVVHYSFEPEWCPNCHVTPSVFRISDSLKAVSLPFLASRSSSGNAFVSSLVTNGGQQSELVSSCLCVIGILWTCDYCAPRTIARHACYNGRTLFWLCERKKSEPRVQLFTVALLVIFGDLNARLIHISTAAAAAAAARRPPCCFCVGAAFFFGYLAV